MVMHLEGLATDSMLWWGGGGHGHEAINNFIEETETCH